MIGDSDVDVTTAKAASVPVILVNFDYAIDKVEGERPEAVIDHFDQLYASLSALLGGTSRRRGGSLSA
jgi:phosphoglycolate phosphatase